jgi:hypothetical protein
MQTSAFKTWLAQQYTRNSAASRYSCAKRVEENYGDLDRHYDEDGLASVLEQLAYSLTDAKANRPNPTSLKISGNPYSSLNSFKTGVRSYKAFRDSGGEAEVVAEAAIERAAEELTARREGKEFELERHLQESLRAEIEQLEPGLKIIDDGTERSVASGDIDILAQDRTGALLVIELKRGLARREAIGQIIGYMGDLMAEEPNQSVRGLLVAGDFDKSCKAGVRAVPNLQLRKYRFSFTFEAPGD